MALGVDSVFAAELARLCGAAVWREVRASVGKRLRDLYAIRDENYRALALAAMLATGSEDFKDILLPLVSSEDQQVRLGTSPPPARHPARMPRRGLAGTASAAGMKARSRGFRRRIVASPSTQRRCGVCS